MSTNGIHNVPIQERQYSNSTRPKQHNILLNSIQRSSTSRTQGEPVNRLTQIRPLLIPLLPNLLQDTSHNNKALLQAQSETQSTSTNEDHSETEIHEDIGENEESSEVDDSSEIEDNKDESDDNNKDNKDVSKCSKTYYLEGHKFRIIEYFKGSCPVGWDSVE